MKEAFKPARFLFPILFSLSLLSPGCNKGSEGAGPQSTLADFIASAKENNAGEARRHIGKKTLQMLDEFGRMADELEATSVPKDLFASLLESFSRSKPQVLGSHIEGEKAELMVKYAQGHKATLRFSLEEGIWKLDFSKELKSSIELLENARKLRESIDPKHQLLKSPQPS